MHIGIAIAAGIFPAIAVATCAAPAYASILTADACSPTVPAQGWCEKAHSLRQHLPA